MNTALYRRCAAHINSTIGNGSIQSWNCFKKFTKERQNYNGAKFLVFVDEKHPFALDHKTPYQ